MSNFFEDLKRYFKTTPKEEILRVWEKSIQMDSVGVTVEEFLMSSHNYYYRFSSVPNKNCIKYLNNNLKPEVNFGFFYIN